MDHVEKVKQAQKVISDITGYENTIVEAVFKDGTKVIHSEGREEGASRNIKKFAISRPIEGISLNGDEYLLDENDDIMTFETEKEAIDFLKDKGFNDDDISSLNINTISDSI